MKHVIILMLFYLCFINCIQPKKQTLCNTPQNNTITCTKKACQGTYKGAEFIKSDDIAHQFSNRIAAAVGDQLKVLYKSGNYSKTDF